MSDVLNFLASLPVGYMFAYDGDVVPEDFLVVSGQKLCKKDYPLLYLILTNIVLDDGNDFILPTAESIAGLFPNSAGKIIVKVR